MVSTFTTNVQLEEPARGDDVGTWDTPVNNNMTLIDLLVGGVVTISGAAGSVVLAAAQFQSKTITLNSTLLASITVTFPTSFKKSYEIQNLCTGSSQFVITLQTTAAGGQVICAPPGETTECFTDGTNVKFKNLARVGSYWDYAGSSVPAWVSGCTVPPYLNCDGSAVSSATYPTLFSQIGATLPDVRGRVRYTLDQSAGRISSAATGFSGSSVGSFGGSQATTLSSVNIPPVPITDPSHTHGVTQGTFGTALAVFSGGGTAGFTGTGANASGNLFGGPGGVTITAAVTGISAGSTTPTSFTNLPPAVIAGLTMIRAA